MATTSSVRAYLAGFFDGEGNVGATGPRVRLQIVQVDQACLERLRAETGGIGKIHRRRDGTSCWAIMHREEIREFVRLVRPYARLKLSELLVADEIASLTRLGRKPTASAVEAARYEQEHQRRLELVARLRKTAKTRGKRLV